MTDTFFALIVVALVAGCTALPPLSDGEARVVPASAWGSIPAEPGRLKPHAVERITLHHGGVPYRKDRVTAEYLQSLQAWSRREKGWADVPYHYVIDPAGVIHEGRPIGFAGDTNTDYDPTGHALVVVLGNFEEEVPSERQLSAAVDAMAMIAARHGVPTDRIAGHKDHSGQTVCPGRNLARYLDDGWFRAQVAERLRTAPMSEKGP
ncbi:MAG: N-acetylmuramoyl-L-alanine amidase [Betaproteobacteria bacterium]|nr:N-acetylmuramoyl-L-alanine amidase [Betaproteobacteria bacterium]